MPLVAAITGPWWHALLWWHALGFAALAPGSGVLAAATAATAATVTVATVVLLVGLLTYAAIAALWLGRANPRTVRDRTLRRHAWRTAFLPQRDPDARGRVRPRAPSAALAAG